MTSFPACGLWTTTVPSLMPISENDALRSGSGWSAWASDWISPDQFVSPSGRNVTVIVGRTSVTSAISMRPASSGK